MANYYQVKQAYKNSDMLDGTYSLFEFDDVSFNSGYQVSFEREQDHYSQAQYNDIVNRLEKDFGQPYIGVWQGNVELSFHIMNLADATRIGKLFEQYAIWDWKNSTEIYLKGETK